MEELNIKGALAKKASVILGVKSESEKNELLRLIAKRLVEKTEYILAENLKDIEKGKSNNMSDGLLDRLRLTDARIRDIAEGVSQIADLPDPIGQVIEEFSRPNGLEIKKVRVPLGVIGIIYEARPNVTADAFALCLKSGNAVILRGGKEAINSNKALVSVMKEAISEMNFPEGTLSLVENTDRESAKALMTLNEYLDVIIPRGGAGLIRSVVENATVPAIQTGTGNCHIYVDKTADIEMAKNIVINAKTSRPSVCNAEEKLLVHRDIAKDFLPVIIPALTEKDVEILGDEKVNDLYNYIKIATNEEWYEEFLSLKIGIKIVENTEEAIEHINKYGSLHSEAIVTSSQEDADKFLKEVDAAAVYVNASTRFTDGFEFGFGGEIGISTQKLHARGPMGLRELTSTKYRIYGNGQIR
ncbi:MAG: glutamate-5-semialdehyde dehydrogenase [Clostridia bacterium]|nr:glutamate-5-semialdehyde dehydrogenase [Clostridia bacterium]